MLLESISSNAESASLKPRVLPRRDWVLLPLLSLATVLVLLGAAELEARYFWPAQEEDACFHGGRFIPGCSAMVKIPEGEWSIDRYNDCGYRSRLSCQKDGAAYRVVLLGSSAAHGLYLPFENTFGALAEEALAKRLGRPVDVQNLGVPNTAPDQWAARMSEILSLKPDAVVFTLTPFDVERLGAVSGKRSLGSPQANGIKRLQQAVTGSRAALIAQHYLFSQRDRFLSFYLLYGDKADFLREPLSAAWQKRFELLDEVIGHAAAQLRAARIPLYLLILPSRAEVALLNGEERPASVNPFLYRDQVAVIANRHGAQVIDAVGAFAKLHHPEDLFYVVDGHMKPEGQALVAREMAEKLDAR